MRANTLEDIGRLAVAASRAVSRARGMRCENEIRYWDEDDVYRVERCVDIEPDEAQRCDVCRHLRHAARVESNRARNTLLSAIRSYRKRNEG